MSRFFHRFRNLHWKLTLAYTLVTTFLFLLLVFVVPYAFMLSMFYSGSNMYTGSLSTAMYNLGQDLAEEFGRESLDMAAVEEILDLACTDITRSAFSSSFQMSQEPCTVDAYKSMSITTEVLESGMRIQNGIQNLHFIAIVDRSGTIIASRPSDVPEERILANIIPEKRAKLQSVIDGDSYWTTESVWERLQTSTGVAVEPIQTFRGSIDDHEHIFHGALIVKFGPPPFNIEMDLQTLIGAAIIIFPVTFIVSLIASSLITRRVVRRLQQVEATSESWAEGNFSVLIDDSKPDEVGRLAQRLNGMAEQLQTLLATRTELAAVDERNRLARDLHDAAKQQIFATAMRLGTAKALLYNEPDAAQKQIVEAEKLAKQVAKELAGIIQELRPAQLEDKGLFAAIRETAQSFSEQQGISADVRIQGERELPFNLELPLYRIFQESLNNVAKHSAANNVVIHATADPEAITLTIQDDGIGFEPSHKIQNGVGLSSMQERAEAIAAELTIDSTVGQGTQIQVKCPLIK